MAQRGPRWYFNFRSPYSWLAHHDLTARHPDVAGRVEWIPYWDPDPVSERLLAEAGGSFLYTPMSREKHFYVLTDVRRLATDRGLAVSWPLDREPVWETAHLAWFLAADQGVGPAYTDLVYRARFQDGEDINDPSLIAEIAGRLGLDPAAAGSAAEDPALRERATAALMSAYRDGVFGPPFLIAGREKFWGLDRLDRFADAVRSAAATPAPAPAPSAAPVPAAALSATPSGDLGHAGGCG
ncbi:MULTISPECIES: 2-hydroxychromene-2-carboxylate isomerase [Streptomyces]|uniref:2-hydroxychromene-2-carboxylate isomerase n=1 Tax=Streptomyces TaxID=1883 RepID=UPI0029C574C3|nr:DsbA family protein [Streptomyces sp. ID01-9D]MDX5574056.1 DsbA family protein [Streptomyces sp. ID01-9D]WSV22846.1 DsbA family protein [Streptomyces fimicarius]